MVSFFRNHELLSSSCQLLHCLSLNVNEKLNCMCLSNFVNLWVCFMVMKFMVIALIT
jgi:hypothetical protein